MTRRYIAVRTIPLNLTLSVLLASCAAQKESSVLLLPESTDEYHSLTRAGTREYLGLAGLSLVQPLNPSTDHYVIDRRSAARRLVMENLGRMQPRGFISIVQDQGLLSKVVHLELSESNSTVVRELVFADPLLSQVYREIANTPLNSERPRSFQYTEYTFPERECEGLSNSISHIDSALRDAASAIGIKPALKPGEIEEVIVDGISYSVQIRMQGLLGAFSVGQNSGPLFEAVQSALVNVQECRNDRQGVLREFEFYG